MRICIINEFFHPDNTGGTGTVLSELARTLQDTYADVQIDVITSRNLYREEGVPLAAHENWQGVSITRLATPRPNGLSTLRRLAANLHFSLVALRQVLRRRYDVLLIGTAPPALGFVAEAVKCLTGTPYVYVVYDLEPDRAIAMQVMSAAHPVAGVMRGLQHRWLHAAAKTVVLGRCMQAYLQKTYALPTDRIRVIPVGADPSDLLPQGRQSRFRRDRKVSGFVVLYSGNFGRYHNFDTVLDAAKTLRTTAPDTTFVLVGGGAQREHIAQRVADEDLTNVRMFPFVPKADYPDLLATADASLVTLEPGMEGLCVPSKFYSILASGRPTIAMVSPESEVAYVINEAECGVQIDQGDTARLVDVVTALSQDPAERTRLGRNARRVLTQKYGKGEVARQYYQVFQEAVQGATEPAGETMAAPAFAFRPAPETLPARDQRQERELVREAARARLADLG